MSVTATVATVVITVVVSLGGMVSEAQDCTAERVSSPIAGNGPALVSYLVTDASGTSKYAILPNGCMLINDPDANGVRRDPEDPTE